jgi:hypothetical protein
MIDPSLDSDLYFDKPYLERWDGLIDRWAYSPLLATMNVVHTTSDPLPSHPKPPTLTGHVTESTTLTSLSGTSTPPKTPITSSADRRKYLSSPQARQSTAFPATYIAGDFSNPFVDFNTFTVQLPYVGLKIDVLKYWTRGDKRQPLRYVCRLRPGVEEEDVVFFTVLFELVGDGIVRHDDTMEGKQNGDKGHAVTFPPKLLAHFSLSISLVGRVAASHPDCTFVGSAEIIPPLLPVDVIKLSLGQPLPYSRSSLARTLPNRSATSRRSFAYRELRRSS